MSKTYRTMQGKIVELDKLIMQNETAIAVGNMRVNARGDEIGQGGQIVRKREEIMAEHHRADSVLHASPRQPVQQPINETPAAQSAPSQSEDDSKPKQKPNALKTLADTEKKD